MAAALALVAGSIVAAGSAYADSAPTTPSTSNPTTVSADSLPTPQINGVVWVQTVVGNTVFVGGSFSTARPYGAAAGVSTVKRTSILAYDLTTGDLISTFAPVLNGQVLAIAPTADKKSIYIGGTFTTVNGVAKGRVAKLSAATGRLSTVFKATASSTVRAIEERGSSVYLGGHFSSLNGKTRYQLGAVSTKAGTLSTWAPHLIGGDVSSIAISPAGTRVVIGGSFVSVNGSSTYGYGLASIMRSTGRTTTFTVGKTVRDAGTDAGITSLVATPTAVIGTGYDYGVGGNFEGTFRADWSTGKILWIEDCHGDTYSAAVSGSAVYTAGHAHYCGTIGGFRDTTPATHHRALAFSVAATQKIVKAGTAVNSFVGHPAPALLNWYPEMNVGTYTGKSQASWSVAATSKYVLYGGEFTTVNGAPQQGLARFTVPAAAPNELGPVSSGSQFLTTLASTAPGQVDVSWTSNADPDNATLTYNVYRNGSAVPIYTVKANSNVWYRPRLSWVDTTAVPGQTYQYQVSAEDPFGNRVIGDNSSITVATETPAGYEASVLSDTPQSFWRLGQAAGTAASADETGHAPLSIAGTVTSGTAGPTTDGSTATTFSGAAAYLGTPQPRRTSTKALTIEAWVKVTKGNGGNVVVFGDSFGRTSVISDRQLYVTSSGYPAFALRDTTAATLTGKKAIADGAWHQMAITVTRTKAVLYVDGAAVASRTTPITLTSKWGYWRIAGDRSMISHPYLTGSVADVSIYGTALSGERIAAHFDAAHGS